MLFRFQNQSCYKLNGPKVYRIDKDSHKAYSFSTKIFSLLFFFFFLKTNLNTFVAVSRDHSNTISDKFPCKVSFLINTLWNFQVPYFLA